MEEMVSKSSPSCLSTTHSILMEWAGAHNQLLAEETRLLQLCRLPGSHVDPQEVHNQRRRVAELTEAAERLYARALDWLQSSSS